VFISENVALAPKRLALNLIDFPSILMVVSKNPNGECNPKLGDEDVLGIVLGIGFTLLSLAWTGWSFTAESKINGGR